MADIEITITGVPQAPKWVDVEQIIRSALGHAAGSLTRIAREDRGANYRARGEYRLEYVPRVPSGDARTVRLIVR